MKDLLVGSTGFVGGNLRRIRPKQVILISTIAVFNDSRGKDETAVPDASSAYGINRYQLEQWVREDFSQVTVLRLPAL